MTIPIHDCLVMGKPHGPHNWWYTSSGGGHQLGESFVPDHGTWDSVERNVKQWHCEGTKENIVTKNATDNAGFLWDQYREALDDLRATGAIDGRKYWELTDLVNDYGYAMKMSYPDDLHPDSTERIYNALMQDRGLA